jgi:hypothetical protein
MMLSLILFARNSGWGQAIRAIGGVNGRGLVRRAFRGLLFRPIRV